MFNIQNSLPQAKIWIKMYRCRQCDFRFLHFVPGVSCYNSIEKNTCDSTDLEVEMNFWVNVEAMTEIEIQTRIKQCSEKPDPWYEILKDKVTDWGELYDGKKTLEFNENNFKALISSRRDIKNILIAAVQADTIFGMPNREEFEGNSDGPGSTSRNGKRRTGQKTAGNVK